MDFINNFYSSSCDIIDGVVSSFWCAHVVCAYVCNTFFTHHHHPLYSHLYWEQYFLTVFEILLSPTEKCCCQKYSSVTVIKVILLLLTVIPSLDGYLHQISTNQLKHLSKKNYFNILFQFAYEDDLESSRQGLSRGKTTNKKYWLFAKLHWSKILLKFKNV